MYTRCLDSREGKANIATFKPTHNIHHAPKKKEAMKAEESKP